MSEQNGNGQKLQKAAENVVTTLIARWLVITGMPAMFAVSVWFGGQFIERIDTFMAKVETKFEEKAIKDHEQDIRLTGAERDIEYLKGR